MRIGIRRIVVRNSALMLGTKITLSSGSTYPVFRLCNKRHINQTLGPLRPMP